MLLAIRQRRLRYIGHILRMPKSRVVRRALVALVKGGTVYPKGSLFMDWQAIAMDHLVALTCYPSWGCSQPTFTGKLKPAHKSSMSSKALLGNPAKDELHMISRVESVKGSIVNRGEYPHLFHGLGKMKGPYTIILLSMSLSTSQDG